MARPSNPQIERSFFDVTGAVVPAVSAPHVWMRRQFQAASSPKKSRKRDLRLAAFGLLGAVLGIGGTIAGVSLVKASDRADMYEVQRYDSAQRIVRRAAPQAIYTSHTLSYAPQRPVIQQPLFKLNDRGLVAFPNFNLNPFHPNAPDKLVRTRQQNAKAIEVPTDRLSFETVSGSANAARSICVRLCDGYQHPLGYIKDSADIPGHEALCTAMFPRVPTRVFRVAAGADGIDNAVSSDGKTYRSLPMAYAYQTSIDPACARPRTGVQTVSILKDFTLRAGDAVVLNGKARIFNGSSSYPFTSANFSDFRTAGVVSNTTRKQIDDIVGAGRQERLQREVRQMTRVREANAVDPARAVDIVRGGPALEASANGKSPPAVRVIEITRR